MLKLVNDNEPGQLASVDLRAILAEVEAFVPPLWPLQDYVAVNPFVGMTSRRFLEVRSLLRQIRDCELLPTVRYFRTLVEQGHIAPADIVAAGKRCAEEYPHLYADWDADSTWQCLESGTDNDLHERCYFTASEAIDRRDQSNWTSHIINDVTRHCAGHYDQGQAIWVNPWQDVSLYEAWRDAASRSWRMDMLGIRGFRALIARLPSDPIRAIEEMLHALGVPPRHWRPVLCCQLLSIFGWAAYVKYRAQESKTKSQDACDLAGLLAMRLAYDVALAQAHDGSLPRLFPDSEECEFEVPTPIRARYVLQVAAEIAFERKLRAAMTSRQRARSPVGRKRLQMAFCIDVRSEVMRRHLEALDASIETFGVAGFFGLPFEYVRLGETNGTAQCPVLLRPAFRIHESLGDAWPAEVAVAVRRRMLQRAGRKLWKLFQTSAASCFSFVESFGLFYSAKLFSDGVQWTKPIGTDRYDGVPASRRAALGPDLHRSGTDELPLASKVELAENLLRNLGLTSGFAPIVALCGHASDVVNNPHRAGLDCGACGGHSGEANARVAAALLNDPVVRCGLAERDIAIPVDTWFVPALHRTTTDEIEFFDDGVPEELAERFAEVRRLVQQAGRHCRVERSLRLRDADAADPVRRSRDWAEVRPEWGLAGNAALIVAPRSRTEGLNLGGRAFMHSYDAGRDPEGKVLELIMTAPMVVTSWINWQYYASTVDNRAFGSGNKLIHNVVGQFGILEGNGGDLMTGLPWQSVHDGQRLQHEPLRLLVIIEAPRDAVSRVIDKHALVRDLVNNGWISLVVLDNERWYRWTRHGQWQCDDAEEVRRFLQAPVSAN